MNNSRLSIQYSVTLYNEKRECLPQSTASRAAALAAILRHVGAIGELLGLVSPERLDELNSNSLHLMLVNSGELINQLTEAGFILLNQADEEGKAL
jgi:hypothetical protein